MAEQPGRALSTEQLVHAAWCAETSTTPASINWYVWRLRGKIESDPAQPRFILTGPGVGYRFAI